VTEPHATSFTIGPDHPALPGHFPGRPIVPGVVLLDHVATVARAAFGLGPPLGLPRAKFAAPVLPGQRVDVVLTRPGAGRIAFACSVAGQPVAAGEWRFAP
jgi:3-hydroxymyristoyl/3-hydroxydecanoyl-(acyl carrier protein) dehydratase